MFFCVWFMCRPKFISRMPSMPTVLSIQYYSSEMWTRMPHQVRFFYSSVADRGTNPPRTMEMVDFVSLHHSSGDCVQAPCWIYIAEPLNRAWHFEGAKCLLQNSPLPSSACLPPPPFSALGPRLANKIRTVESGNTHWWNMEDQFKLHHWVQAAPDYQVAFCVTKTT